MAASPECVAAIVDASQGRMNDREAAELLRYMATLHQAEQARGDLPNLEARVRQRAAEDAERARVAAAVAQMHAAKSAVAYAQGLQDLRALRDQGLTWRKSMLAFLEGVIQPVTGGRASIARLAMANIARYTEAWNLAIVRSPELAKRMRDPDFGRLVTREMRELREGGQPGVTGDPAAQQLARVYADVAELARTDLNRLGATIGRLDGWSPQGHDAGRIVRVGPDEWIGHILPRLDLERSFPGADEALARRFLRDIYDEITTGVDRNGLTAETTGRAQTPANLANSLSRSRTLHFRDAEAALTYADRFGSDIHSAMLGHLTAAAKAAAQMERLGPNPRATLTRLLATLMREASQDKRLTPRQRQAQARALDPNNAHGSLASSWAEVSGLTAAPVSLTWARIGTMARTVQSMAKLGRAVVSSLGGDVATGAIAMRFEGMPLLRAWGENLRAAVPGRLSREQREIAAMLNAGMDGIRSRLLAQGMADDAPMGLISKTSAFFFRIQGMTAWQDLRKSGAAEMLSRWMGFNRDRAFDALPPKYRSILRQNGISAAEWDMIRGTARQIDGAHYVTPDMIAALPTRSFAGLAREGLEDLQKGMTERMARRSAADQAEAAWVRKRTERFEAELARAEQRMEAWSKQKGETAARQVAVIRQQMDQVRQRLSELAEFHEALAEGRTWVPATPEPEARRPGIRASEAYLHAATPPEHAVLRAEGEARARLDRLQRAIGRVRQEATRGDVAAMDAFDLAWRGKRAEIDEFIVRMQTRADQRAAATAAEQADWSPRAERVLEDARRRLELKLRGFFADEMGFSFVETDSASRRMALQGTRPGTVTGELLRALTQFKGWPIAFTNRIVGRTVTESGNRTPLDRMLSVAHVGELIATMAFVGYLSMTLKDLLLGYGPRDPTHPATLMAAMLQGGGAGIYGDFLFAEANRVQQHPTLTAAGPLAGAIGDLVKLFQAAREGDIRSGRALNIALQNTPFVSLWYLRPALDFLILNSLREGLSPGFLSRQERDRLRDYGQRRILSATAY